MPVKKQASPAVSCTRGREKFSRSQVRIRSAGRHIKAARETDTTIMATELIMPIHRQILLDS